MSRVKVRFTTWYWGNYCLALPKDAKALPKGFEIYDEEKHGWKNSEEFKNGKEEPYGHETDTLESVLGSTYIRRKQQEIA